MSEESANNVIPFPKRRNIEALDFIPTVVMSNINQVDAVMEELLDLVFEFLGERGYHLLPIGSGGKYDKDIVFMIEAMQSLLMKHHSVEHPFQRVAEQVLAETADGEFAFVIEKKKNEDESGSGEVSSNN